MKTLTKLGQVSVLLPIAHLDWFWNSEIELYNVQGHSLPIKRFQVGLRFKYMVYVDVCLSVN